MKLSLLLSALASVALPGIVGQLAPNSEIPQQPVGLTERDREAIANAHAKRLRKSQRAKLDKAAARQ